jgi:hypothetical protein
MLAARRRGVRRGGTADLPLHYGSVPRWLAERMTALGTAITEAIVTEAGTSAFLARLSDPFWFQALGAVMGMDWHSSGITTSVMGALKRGLAPLSRELGLTVCGGRGRHSRRTPDELRILASQTGLDGEALVRASRLTAKVDNACVQDGFGIYLHCFVVSRDGEWAVVQQGMDTTRRLARRYHWHSRGVRSFVSDPHAAIVGENRGEITNLADSRAESSRAGILSLLHEPPERQVEEIRRLVLPVHHEVRAEDVDSRRLGAALALAYQTELRDFTDALLVSGVGARTLLSLALVAEVIHGAPHRFADPARFAFAHGGKDGHPFPVPIAIYDESISFLKRALEKARVGRSDRLEGLRRLAELSRLVEQLGAPDADVEALIRKEWQDSPGHGGRMAGGQPGTQKPRAESDWVQRDLFE